jgi:hypothetical protein
MAELEQFLIRLALDVNPAAGLHGAADGVMGWFEHEEFLGGNDAGSFSSSIQLLYQGQFFS